jgi:hypothetical protein
MANLLIICTWGYTTSDDGSCTGTSTTSRVRVRAYGVQEDPTLRDGAQKTKTPVVVAGGGKVPVAAGNTREPRTVVPAPTPEDA